MWNNHFVDHVQITAGEELGVEARGRYYEEAGLLRDMIEVVRMDYQEADAFEIRRLLG